MHMSVEYHASSTHPGHGGVVVHEKSSSTRLDSSSRGGKCACWKHFTGVLQLCFGDPFALNQGVLLLFLQLLRITDNIYEDLGLESCDIDGKPHMEFGAVTLAVEDRDIGCGSRPLPSSPFVQVGDETTLESVRQGSHVFPPRIRNSDVYDLEGTIAGPDVVAGSKKQSSSYEERRGISLFLFIWPSFSNNQTGRCATCIQQATVVVGKMRIACP